MKQPEQSGILLLAGGSGFIGNALGEEFARRGWKIRLLTRSDLTHQTAFPCQQIRWDGKSVPHQAVEGAHAVINLAGTGIADKAWNSAYRTLILNSRTDSARAVSRAVLEYGSSVAVVIQASAVGFYGLDDRKDPCHENSEPGDDFLAGVSRAWEEEVRTLSDHKRVVIARTGLVLGWEGGALEKLWDMYAAGVGSALGSGAQWMNWIHLRDVVRFFVEAVESEKYVGPYNLVAPENCSNRSFHIELARLTPSLKMLTAPAWSLKLALGARAGLLLKSPKIVSEKLREADFSFDYPDLSTAMLGLLAVRMGGKRHYVRQKQWLPASKEDIWSFMTDPANLEQITPHWLRFRITGHVPGRIENGTRISYSLNLHGVPLSWNSKISGIVSHSEFSDEQERGPYRVWYHRHLIHELAGGTLIEDRVEYQLPVFPLGNVALPVIKRDLNQIFRYRKKVMAKVHAT